MGPKTFPTNPNSYSLTARCWARRRTKPFDRDKRRHLLSDASPISTSGGTSSICVLRSYKSLKFVRETSRRTLDAPSRYSTGSTCTASTVAAASSTSFYGCFRFLGRISWKVEWWMLMSHIAYAYIVDCIL